MKRTIRVRAAARYTVGDVAKLLGVSRRSVYNWIKSGKLKHVTTGLTTITYGSWLKEFYDARMGKDLKEIEKQKPNNSNTNETTN